MSLKDPNPVNRKRSKRVAIVIANRAVSTTSGWPVGFWWSELTHPYFEFIDRGYEVEIFSPKVGFKSLPHLAALVDNTKPVTALAIDAFDAIVVAGGQSPMFTFDKELELHRRFVEFYTTGKIAAVLCHGVAILRYASLPNGDYLAKGKTVTGFANVEEDYADNVVWQMGLLPRDKHVMPWRVEDELKKIGANYIQVGAWKGFAVRDGNLITGQQNFSGGETARAVVAALGE